ncbi:MAG: EVE domain-containing protein, partial [Bacteroidia bacterium]
DPTTEENWSVVELAPFKKLKKPVTLAAIKANKKLANMDLIRLSRLSVGSVKPDEYGWILEMAQ